MKLVSLLSLILFILMGCGVQDPETLTIHMNPGIDTIEVNTPYIHTNATATIGGLDHPIDVIKNTVDISQVGTYEIVYQTVYLDHEVTATRMVEVIDETPPVLSLNPGIDTIYVGEQWEDAGVSAYDNSYLPVSISKQGIVDESKVGIYYITYYATDYYGNTSEIIRVVTVLEPNMP